MIWHAVLIVGAIGACGPVTAQTKTPDAAGYDSYVRSALTCMADAPGDAEAQTECVALGVMSCRSRAGVYEACLDALADGLDAAAKRIAKKGLEKCDETLDPACAALTRGYVLIRTGQGLSPEDWAAALSGEE